MVLNCDDREHLWLANEAIFHGSLMRNGHMWKFYNAFNSELPTREELKHVRGIIFPGARFATYEGLEWIAKLKEFARMVLEEFPSIKMVGICFGH